MLVESIVQLYNLRNVPTQRKEGRRDRLKIHGERQSLLCRNKTQIVQLIISFMTDNETSWLLTLFLIASGFHLGSATISRQLAINV